MDNNDFEKNEPVQENESNAAKRLRLLGDSCDDKIHDEKEAITKGSFFGNLWYQYKWGIIIGAVLLAIAIIFIVSMVNKPKPDMYLSYAGPLYMDNETRAAVEYTFNSMMEDYNGNGEKLLNFSAITYQNEEQRKQSADEMNANYGVILHSNENYKARTTIQSQMMSGMVAIYLMDEALYKEYEATMLDVGDILGYEPTSLIMAGEGGVYFKRTQLYRYMVDNTEEGKALKSLPDDTVLCILPKLETMDEDMHESSLQLFKDIMNFGK